MTWIALLRGINVGGNNILPMADLRDILAGLGHENVKTYIQSGNCIFDNPSTDAELISDQLSDAIEKRFSFRPKVMCIGADRINSALENNPFPQDPEILKNLHMFFMTEKPKAIDDELLSSIQKEGEEYKYLNRVFYLYAPNGIWKSKIGARVEKILGVPMTARNLRTVMKLQALTA